MGPLLDWNTPYWKTMLLPLYADFARKLGDRAAGLILWEPTFRYDSPESQERFKAQRPDRLHPVDVCRPVEQVDRTCATLRIAGWKGTLIGGGWGALEWEEQMWDGTLGQMYAKRDQLEPFRRGLIPIVMPELLVHAMYGCHEYRRTDLHFVYRSLMYERSVYGDQIIPNFELYWERSMKPDEVLRWILESYTGLPLVQRSQFGKALPGSPGREPGGLSSAMARDLQEGQRAALFRPAGDQFSVHRVRRSGTQADAGLPVAWAGGGWEKKTRWHQGNAFGVQSMASGKPYRVDVSVGDGPVATTQIAGNVAPEIIIHAKPGAYELEISLADDAKHSGSLLVDLHRQARQGPFAGHISYPRPWGDHKTSLRRHRGDVSPRRTTPITSRRASSCCCGSSPQTATGWILP